MKEEFPGFSVVHLEETKSTNDDVFFLLQRHEAGLVWTRNQSQGRGSRGRSWLCPRGRGLAISLGFCGNRVPDPNQFSFPLFAGVLLWDCLVALDPGASPVLHLKWPNDLLLNGRKLAGILCESRWFGSDLQIVVGMGVNLRRHVGFEELPKGFETLDGLQKPPSAESLVAEIENRFAPLLRQFDRPEHLHQAWLHRCGLPLGQELDVALEGHRYRGRFSGLGPGGCLVLEMADGKRRQLSHSSPDLEIRAL